MYYINRYSYVSRRLAIVTLFKTDRCLFAQPKAAKRNIVTFQVGI